MGIALGASAISDVKLGTNQVNKIYLGSTEVWSKTPAPGIKALKFTSSGAQTLGVDTTKLGTISPNFEYSTDDGATWTTWDVTTTIPFGNGTDLYVRGMNTDLCAGDTSNRTTFVFSTSSPVNCSGSVMHLFDYTQDLTAFPGVHGIENLFRGCSALVSAPELPATTLKEYCYRSTFNSCTNLVSAPALPATNLSAYCYNYMFYKCTNLVNPPALPAMTVRRYAYSNMFNDCTSLDKIPALPGDVINYYGYHDMFYGCTSIKMSLTQSSEYPNIYKFGVAPAYNAPNMFGGTGGSYTGPGSGQIATDTLYTSNTIIS